METVLRYLKQRSTYAGLATLVGLTGIVISPEQWQSISAALIALVAVYETFRDEK